MSRDRFAGKRYAWLPHLIVLVTGVALAFGVFALHEMEANLVKAAGQTVALAAAAVTDKVDLLLDERARRVQAIAREATFHLANRSVLSTNLAGIQAAYPDYIWIGFMDDRGIIVAATDPTTVGLDWSRSPGFQKARERRHIIWQDVEPVEGVSGVDGVGWAVPVVGPHGEFLGVISTRIGLPLLEDLLTKTIKLFQTQGGFLGTLEYQFTTSEGNVFIDSDLWHKGFVNLKRLGLPSALMSGSDRPGFVEEAHLRRHVPVITGYATSGAREGPEPSRWVILIRADRAEVLRPIHTALWKAGAMGALVYIPLLGILLWTSKNVRREWVKVQMEEARATAAEAKYRLLLESTGEGLYGIDREGCCIFINQAGAAMLGYTSAELLGKVMHQAHHHSHADGTPYPIENCPICRVFRNGNGCRADDEVFWRKDGTRFPIEYVSHPILDADAVIGAVVRFTDISDRKQIEETLRLERDTTREYLHVAGVMFLVLNPDATVRLINRKGCEILGRKEQDIVGKNWIETFLPERDRDELSAAFSLLMAGKLQTVEHIENPVLTTHGGERIIAWHNTVLKDAAGHIVGTLSSGEDITERKQAEANLKLFKCVVDQTHDPIYWLSPEEGFRFVYVNEAACRHYGYPAETLLQMSVPDWDPNFSIEACDKFWKELKGQRSRSFETLHRRSTGEIVAVEVTTNYVAIAGKEYIAGTIRDITERKQAEKALRQSEEQLRQTLEERLQLSRDLHDNIIQTVFAVSLSLGRYKRRSSGEMINGTDILTQAIMILNQVISDVRGYIEVDRRQQVTDAQLPAALRRMSFTLNGMHTPRFRIKLDRTVLMQLTPEAAKQVLFIAQEGMANSARHSRGTSCHVSLSEDQRNLHLEISDDGVGFDVSEQTGSGWGLANIRTRARQLNARLQILSKPGEGTRIVVEFAKEQHGQTTT